MDSTTDGLIRMAAVPLPESGKLGASVTELLDQVGDDGVGRVAGRNIT